MKVKLSSEVYLIDGHTKDGLIPRGVVSAIVNYQGGIIEGVYFTPVSITKARTKAALKRAEADVQTANKGLDSQERRDAVVGLLKRLASQ